MKMKHLKTFENFSTGRFDDVDADEQEWLDKVNQNKEGFEEEENEFGNEGQEEEEEEEEFDNIDEEEAEKKTRLWGDEPKSDLTVEKKKMNAGFKAYLDKKKGKAVDKKDDKKSDKKEDKKEDKKVDNKGLSAAQKKLPAALQKSILAKKKK